MPDNHMTDVVADASLSEAIRLAALSDRWLAETILREARSARRSGGKQFENPSGNSTICFHLWHAVPEVARRLGGRLYVDEGTDPVLLGLEGRGIRLSAGWILRKVMLPGSPLGLAPELANPFVIGVDRVCPPEKPRPHIDDWIAWKIAAHARRSGLGVLFKWTPDLLLPAPQHSATILQGPGTFRSPST